jgi:lysophospholipase L1-like esterase
VVSETDAESTILAVGDSFFEYNALQQASIPDVLGETIGISVVNAAMSGAYFANPDPAAGADGLDVRSQYREGDWEWVVVTGGGNDLNDLCGCGECVDVLDALIAADGLSGEIPDFVKGIAADGIDVMLVGYYEVPSDADYGFDQCGDEFSELSTRLEVIADSTDGVWFVSAADVVTADETSAYANDRVHPSIAGSKLIGEHIAAAMQNIENN